MLSRFSLGGSQTFARCLVKFQPAFALTTSATTPDSTSIKKDIASSPGTGHLPEYPPASSKRDYVNFPRLVLKEASPPVRLGFIPESFFQFFYPKTGYTGPYMLLIGTGIYVCSKEILVMDHNAVHLISFILLLYVINLKFGDKIGQAYNKALEEEINFLDNFQNEEKQIISKNIDVLQTDVDLKDDVIEILKGRVETVHLQMEMHFRQRLLDAYKTVKNKLDCLVELENAERRIERRNLVDYVIRNVMKSITPDLEKNALQMSISELNALAAKA